MHGASRMERGSTQLLTCGRPWEKIRSECLISIGVTSLDSESLTLYVLSISVLAPTRATSHEAHARAQRRQTRLERRTRARFVSTWDICNRNGLDPRDRPSRDHPTSAVGPHALGM